ncbi:MAG: hypothetical protein EA398_17065 [Deltaproteobacteria bacterium]|nr:MAG: hypothetical protein EA398_17065 [Deltaproteobacteria bacterium]
MTIPCAHCGATTADPMYCGSCGTARDGEALLAPGKTVHFPDRDLRIAVDEPVPHAPGEWLGRSDDGRRWRLLASRVDTTPAAPSGPLARSLDLPAAGLPLEDGRGSLLLFPDVPTRPWQGLAAPSAQLTTPEGLQRWLRPLLHLLEQAHAAQLALPMIRPDLLRERSGGELLLHRVSALPRLGAQPNLLPLHPPWAAPELLSELPPGHLHPGADLHAVGMVAWSVLTGAPPPLAPSLGPLPAVPLRALRPDLPPDTAAILALLTHPDPDLRAPDVAAVLDALQRLNARPAPSGSLLLEFAAETHVGIGKRRWTAENQDGVLRLEEHSPELALVAVADGVSTASVGSGDLASRTALDALTLSWQSRDGDLPASPSEEEAWLADAMDAANDALVDCVNHRWGPFECPPDEVMGTTLLCAVIHRDHVTLGSLGDSRAYLLRAGQLLRLNRDHNLATMAIADGADPEAALALPQAEALTRCIGMFDADDIGDLLISQPAAPDLLSFPLCAGDRLLLCSDGVTDYIAETEKRAERAVRSILLTQPDPDLAALEILLAANRGGGGDNASVVLVDAVHLDPFDDEAETDNHRDR